MKPEEYAKAIFELSQSGKSADEVVKGMIKSLKARGAMGLLPNVLSSYERLVKQAGAQGSILTVAKETDASKALVASNAKQDSKIIIDESIIGGYRLENDSKLIDNSIKSQLLQVYRKATKA